MSKGKILALILVVAVGGYLFWRWRNRAVIEVKSTDKETKTVEFEMRYKGDKMTGKATVGGIRRHLVNGNQFLAFTQGETIVLQIKDSSNTVVAEKKIPFDGQG